MNAFVRKWYHSGYIFLIVSSYICLQIFTSRLEKTLMPGGIGGRRRRGQPRLRWLDGITDSMDVSLSPGVGDGQGGLACCDSWGPKESDTTERLN